MPEPMPLTPVLTLLLARADRAEAGREADPGAGSSGSRLIDHLMIDQLSPSVGPSGRHGGGSEGERAMPRAMTGIGAVKSGLRGRTSVRCDCLALDRPCKGAAHT